MSNHIEAKLAMRQSPGTFFLGTIGMLKAWTLRVVTVEDGKPETADALEGRNGAASMIGHPGCHRRQNRFDGPAPKSGSE